MELTGKIAVVTGGSQGIGAAIARQLAADGAMVGIIASSDVGKAKAVVAEIEAKGGKAFAEAANVTDVAGVQALVERVIAKYGRIDILINSAGVFYPTPVTEGADIPAAHRMIDINLNGTFNVIAAVAPHMKKTGGKIVNIASCAGVMGLKAYSVYCATKAAIIMLSRSLAIELAPFDINVNAIAPGNTATPMNEDIRTKPELAGFLTAMAERTPSGQTYSEPQDMANLVSFLVSSKSRAIHGATVLADEGFSAGM
ncbi:MAG: short-chain dehydrogenase [Ancylobacter novellus]|uniref:Short-chain dehydrogenase n=1 Tax=Ancylobacter novellus TaxID=921 RepID=A0A2W5QVD6_ANCNO|nr:MAG: short-chain dehydrogenase [Ancylobacter novellus]